MKDSKKPKPEPANYSIPIPELSGLQNLFQNVLGTADPQKDDTKLRRRPSAPTLNRRRTVEILGSASVNEVRRRTEDEASELTQDFQYIMELDSVSQTRLLFYWPSEQSQLDVLHTLSYDVPSGHHPCDLDDVDSSVADIAREILSVDPKAFSAENLKARPTTDRRRCVEWMGLCNKQNGFAAIRIKMPATFEFWVTYTNRLVAYLFATLPVEAAENFDAMLGTLPGEPFPMKCENPRCVKLSHIDLLRFYDPATNPFANLLAPHVRTLLDPAAWYGSKRDKLQMDELNLRAQSNRYEEEGEEVIDAEALKPKRPGLDLGMWSPGFHTA